MSYEIYNTPASIGFHSATGDVLLPKWGIKEINVSGDTIKINTGDCGSGIVFRHKDVSTPVTASPVALMNLLNDWLANFVPPPDPEE